MKRPDIRSAAFHVVTVLMFAAIAGQARAAQSEPSLADLSIEDLMNESVTSVGKKASRLVDSPAAISVITQEDIRRSGYTSLPELLRLVPGLDVARINGNTWAISARGFNAQYGNKLLVLIDGRTVYTPSSGGVYWNVQDPILEDIERIEVIRGPGATLWGTNAVNGVINVITRNARETQGLLISGATGSEDSADLAARYGGQIGPDLNYRGYVKYFNRPGLVDSNGADVLDGQSAIRVGGRADWKSGSDSVMVQAEGYETQTHNQVVLTSVQPPYSTTQELSAGNHGASLVGSWTRAVSDTSQLTIQGYWQHLQQNYGFGVEYQDSYDLDLQYHLKLGPRNDVVWGVGYRRSTVQETPTSTLSWMPETVRLPLYQAFVQDEISLAPERWRLVLGGKVEHNILTGLELEPTARLLWTPGAASTVWASFSRATRLPALFERDGDLTAAAFQPPASPPVWVKLRGDPEVDEEKLLAYELGYRVQPLDSLSIDIATFYNVYHDLIAFAPREPIFQATPAPPHILLASVESNSQNAQTYGAEISVQWRVLPNWRLLGSYSGLRMHVRPDPAIEGESPRQQAQLRSYLDLPGRIEFNASIAYVDALTVVPVTTAVRIPAYVRLDLGVTWRANDSWQLGVWGENLLDSRHAEFPSVQTPLLVEVPRSVLARATWQFR